MIEFLKSEDEGKVCKISEVAIFSRIDLLEIIYREKYDFLVNVQVINEAACYGKLEVVKYLTESGASCSVNAMDFAAMNGHLKMVKFLHLNRSEGCDSALIDASFKGHFEVVKYLVENAIGMDFIQLAIDVARRNGHLEITEYLQDHMLVI